MTEEEDDLWSSLPQSVLASQNEQLQYLQNKLSGMKEQTQDLNSQGPQLVFVSTKYLTFSTVVAQHRIATETKENSAKRLDFEGQFCVTFPLFEILKDYYMTVVQNCRA